MDRLQIAAVGFNPEDPRGPQLPPGLKETGWILVLHPDPHPSEAWLQSQTADLFVIPARYERAVELTATIGRLTRKPVVWIGDAPEQPPARLWERVATRDWPLWALLPEQAPRWVVVATCRGLVVAAERFASAAARIHELEQKLEDRKIIERAKGILMEKFDLAESEAYKRLRDTAMRQRKSLREIAQGILAFMDSENR